jgi:hypothetical protein
MKSKELLFCLSSDTVVNPCGTQVDQSDVGSYRIRCWILSDPTIRQNPIGFRVTKSLRIPSFLDPIGSNIGFDSFQQSDPIGAEDHNLILLKRTLIKFVAIDFLPTESNAIDKISTFMVVRAWSYAIPSVN